MIELSEARFNGTVEHRAPTDTSPSISVVVTVTERPEPLVELFEEYAAPLRALGRPFEFIFVSSPHARSLLVPLQALIARGEPIHCIETAGHTVGDTPLLRVALERCRGEVVLTLPAYRQIEAEAIRELIARVEHGTDLVVACRWPRHDALINRLQNRVLGMVVNPLTQGRMRDVGCGVRAAHRDVLQNLPLYGDFSRFLPLLALYNGYHVEEAPCRQHPNNMRGRIYSPGVYLRRLIDVFGLFFLLRFTEKPLRFFGLVGSMFTLSGAVLLLWLFVERVGGEGIGGRPLLILSVLLFTLGIQAIALGLIGEMIVHYGAARGRGYRVRADSLPSQR